MYFPLCTLTIDYTLTFTCELILLSSILRCLVKSFLFIWTQTCRKVTSGQMANVDAVLGSYVTGKPYIVPPKL